MNTPTTGRNAKSAALLLTVFFVFLATLPAPAWAQSEADVACRDWYERQTPEEQAREDNEARLGEDVDKDGCTAILAAPDSDGPVEGALEEGGVSEGELAEAEESGGGSEEPADEEGQPDCAEQFAAEDPEEQMREREEDLRFNVDNDGDGCIADQAAEDSTGMDGTPADAPEGEPVPESTPRSSDDGGLAEMVLGFFKDILLWVWDNTFGWVLEEMAGAFETSLLSLPTLEGRGDLLGFYTGAVEKLRPAILVGILILGILMMVRSDNYDLAYAGFQGLPRLMGVAMAMAFLPQFMSELASITAGITDAFFPSGQNVNGAGQELFKAAVGNMALANFLNVILLIAAAWVGMLVVVVALLKSILYAILFIAGPFALVTSLMPGLSSLAGSWFRGVLACAAIPALWSIELGIGTFAVTSPESIFGEGANALGFISESAVTAVGAILILWVMYKTPFKVIEWAFNVQLPGRGGLVGLAKTAASLAVAIPVKTAIATGVKGVMSRGSGTGGAAVKGAVGGAKPDTAMPGKTYGAGGGEARRTVQQAQREGRQGRRAENVSKSTYKYLKQMDGRDEAREEFMQGRPRDAGGPGTRRNPSRDRTRSKE